MAGEKTGPPGPVRGRVQTENGSGEYAIDTLGALVRVGIGYHPPENNENATGTEESYDTVIWASTPTEAAQLRVFIAKVEQFLNEMFPPGQGGG